MYSDLFPTSIAYCVRENNPWHLGLKYNTYYSQFLSALHVYSYTNTDPECRFKELFPYSASPLCSCGCFDALVMLHLHNADFKDWLFADWPQCPSACLIFHLDDLNLMWLANPVIHFSSPQPAFVIQFVIQSLNWLCIYASLCWNHKLVLYKLSYSLWLFTADNVQKWKDFLQPLISSQQYYCPKIHSSNP